jgi:hypothetical protein
LGRNRRRRIERAQALTASPASEEREASWSAVVLDRFPSRRDARGSRTHLAFDLRTVRKRQRAGALQDLTGCQASNDREASWSAVVLDRFPSRRDARSSRTHLASDLRTVRKRQRAGALQDLTGCQASNDREASWRAVVLDRFPSRRDARGSRTHLASDLRTVRKRQRAGALQDLTGCQASNDREASWSAVVLDRFPSRRDSHGSGAHLAFDLRTVRKRQRAGALQDLTGCQASNDREASWRAVVLDRFPSRRDARGSRTHLASDLRTVRKRQGAGALQDLTGCQASNDREASWSAVVLDRFPSRRDARGSRTHLASDLRTVRKRQRAGALQDLTGCQASNDREAS